MLKQATTLVLGAGASEPYGLPVASTLKWEIVNNPARATILVSTPPPDPEQLEMLRDNARQFTRALAHSLLPSIDVFLEKRPQYQKEGKTAIAACLLPKEGNALHDPPAERDWIARLFSSMYRDYESFFANPLAVITFNYDRVFELAIATALCNASGRPLAECWADVRKRMQVFHVYGELAVEPSIGQRDLFPVIRKDESATIEAAKGIQIMSDERSTVASMVLAKAREAIRNAERLIFLGFSYDSTNLERIGVSRDSSSWRSNGGTNIWGTAYGLLEQEKRDAEKCIVHQCSLGAPNDDCLTFLRRQVSL